MGYSPILGEKKPRGTVSNVGGWQAATPGLPSLILRVGSCACALPLAHAGETMRPLPIEPVDGSPPFVLGLAIIRGRPTAVVHLARLLGAPDRESVSRFVTVRLDDRAVALAVAGVLGIRVLEARSLETLPTVLGADGDVAIERVGQLDGRLLLVLQAIRILPDALWPPIRAAQQAAP